MATVFRARRDDGETVALKVMRRAFANDEVYAHRFVHEARSAAEVRHEHLVPILDAGEVDGIRYLAAGYVAGPTLEQRLEAGPLPLADVVRVVAEIASGLDALHASGVVHRDIKASNILLDERGRALLTDFGLARGREYTRLTRPGQVLGTLDYLAPELIKGEPATAASDIYALGCVTYECVTGDTPFGHKSVLQVGLAHLEEEPPDPAAVRTDCTPQLAWAVVQALHKEPAQRPPTATAYATMLQVATRPPERTV
jgi:eukaryotic-like serine/threonine-protein kinase